MNTSTLLLALMLPLCSAAAPQQADSTGLAGDRFSLRGALDLFRQAKDLDAFEQALNTAENHVSNLDLNDDGEVDYVRVRTQVDGEARVVVLQAVLSKDEAQDIAAIEMERKGSSEAVLQIRGDELLYPEGTIIEPNEEAKDAGRKAGGPFAPPAQVTVWVNVWYWPMVQWCYGPQWNGWGSPWYWGYCPPWWRPWRPWGWSMWWGFPRPYWGWYHPVHYCRVELAHNLYMHRRTVSPRVQQRPDAVRPGKGVEPAARPDRRDPHVRPQDQGRGREPVVRPERAPDGVPRTQPSERRPRPERTAPAPRPAPQPRTAPRSAPGRAPGGGGRR
jgi:hypothetical protein